jgi:hypothetical protein
MLQMDYLVDSLVQIEFDDQLLLPLVPITNIMLMVTKS